MSKILVYGAGGLGTGVIELLECINSASLKPWKILGFVDDHAIGIINGYEVWGTTEDLLKINEHISIVLALGDPEIRERIHDKLKYNTKIQYPNLIHPSVENSRSNLIGYGNVISKGVSMSTNIKLRNFNLIHYNSSIGHDVSIGSYNSIFPITSLSGYVILRDGIEIGSNSTILPSIKVEHRVRVGAGSVVTKDIEENITVTGVPARKVKKIK